MNILVLNGSPRKNGNTAAFTKVFKEEAEKNGNTVDLQNLAALTYGPCKACDYCQGAGKGRCVQKDDAAEIINRLPEYDMVVFASPVYYWGFSGQMQSFISRFYPYGPVPVKKYALILSSGSEGVYNGIVSQYRDMLDYFGGESLGEFFFNGENQQIPENINRIRAFAGSLTVVKQKI